MKHLIIYAHPNPRSFNHAIKETVLETYRSRGDKAEVRDLYAMGFDPVLSGKELELGLKGKVVGDIREEQRRVWREVDSTFANSQAAAMATSADWTTREEARMP